MTTARRFSNALVAAAALLSVADDGSAPASQHASESAGTAEPTRSAGGACALGLSASQRHLVMSHAGLVQRAARSISHRHGLELDECISAGNLGLVEAARTYDAAQNDSFEHFARSRVWGEMIDSGVRLKRTAARGLVRAAERFAAKRDGSASYERCQFADTDAADACHVLAATCVPGLGDAVCQAQGEDAVIADESAGALRQSVAAVAVRLSPPARAILERHMLGDETLLDVANSLCISERHARRHKSKVLADLQREMSRLA